MAAAGLVISSEHEKNARWAGLDIPQPPSDCGSRFTKAIHGDTLNSYDRPAARWHPSGIYTWRSNSGSVTSAATSSMTQRDSQNRRRS